MENIKPIKPLKILIISFDLRDIYSENHDELIRKLKRDRLNPEINSFFFLSWSNKTYYKKINNFETQHLKAFKLKWRLIYDFLSIFLTPFILKRKKFKPDVVLIYDFPFIFSSIIIKILWKVRIVLLVSSLPSSLVKTRKLSKVKYIYQNICEFLGKYFVDYFFVISEATRKYVENLKINSLKIKNISLDIIERDKDFIMKSEKGKIRKKYNIEGSKKIILSVARLEKEKGLERLIDNYNNLENNELILIIVGTGILEKQLKEKVKILGIDNRVIFAGDISREEIWDYYNDADVFILLSLSEGLGLVFWEAMYVGVPVIGSKVGGIVDTIGLNNERGMIWERGSDDFKNKIKFCLENSEIKNEMIKNAKNFVEMKIKDKNNINSLI